MAHDSVVDVLQKARDLVARPNGWRQRGYGTADKCCAIGAIIMACGRSFPDQEAAMFLAPGNEAGGYLLKAIHARHIDDWNDDPDRTQEEVVSAFSKAIELRLAELGR